jgi:leucine-rich repeat kinase 2
VRLGSEYGGLDFWLSSISCHAPNTPIFVVGTHIDEVPKYYLNEVKLKEKFEKIVGFYYVSNLTKSGIAKLAKDLVEVTLKEKYMGEQIPSAYISFEDKIKECRRENKSLIDYYDLTLLAHEAGIFEPTEVLDAIRFLSDLGSLQYFEDNFLKNRVVINPQWIIDVITCIISVKESIIKDGHLYHDDKQKIWKKYDPSLHDWILKLTEEFDLTYSLPNKQMNIVPCLLKDEPILNKWKPLSDLEVDERKRSFYKIVEFRVVYTFNYLPAGLFNRVQVRLYQYSTDIWKTGSVLVKNGHLALFVQKENSTIELRVRGTKPGNIVLLIHEVIELLVKESFNGVKFDFR